MSSCRYRKSHCGDKTISRPSYLHNGISYTGKVSSLYWIGAQTGIMQHRAQSHIKKQRNLTTAKLHILKKIITHRENTIAFIIGLYLIFRWHVTQHVETEIVTQADFRPGPRFNIKMTPYQYRKSIVEIRWSYLHNEISYTDKKISLYWIGAQNPDKIDRKRLRLESPPRLSGSKTVLHLD